MSEFRNRETGELVTEDAFRNLHPLMSFPPAIPLDILNRLGFDPVLSSPVPSAGAFELVERNGATQDVHGNWVQAWRVSQLDQATVDEEKSKAKDVAWEGIKTERDRREEGGVLVGDKWFHSDQSSRIKQLGLAMAGAAINGAGIQWKTMDGSFVTMTSTLAGQIFSASLAATGAIFAKAEWHKAQMEAAENPATYNYLTGWPSIFGE